jgi:uncharacterized membrane protein
MLVVFIAIATFLAFQQHAAFQTNLYDLGAYTHVVWNTSQGRFFVTSLTPGNYLTNHFSLLLLLLAPLFFIWPDPRTLMAVQQIILACTIIPAYLILRRHYPRLAPVLVLAFVLSPLLHQTAFAEFHGVMLATPFLAWAFYALYQKRTWMLVIALGLALLAREDVGLYVASFGLFLLVCRKGQRWLGVSLIILGGGWVIAIINWVMPALGRAYHHFNNFSALGNSMPEIASNALKDPGRVLGILLQTSKLKALVSFIAPLAGLPLLASGYALLWIPMTFVYLISNVSGSGLLNSWRMAPFLPLLWGSIAVLLVRLKPRQVVAVLAVLLASTLIGFAVLSPFPGGGKFDASLYQINGHTRIGEQIVASIPADAYVAAQNGMAAHLATRQRIRLFPNFDHTQPPDIIILDERASNRFPMSNDDYASALSDLQIDPGFDVALEQDGFFVFKRTNGRPQSARSISATWSSMLRLDSFELAQKHLDDAYVPVTDSVRSGGVLRVALYLTALEPMSSHYAISVRLLSPDGKVAAQDDSWPAHGALPTPLWNAGRSIRDTHYLDLSHVPPAQQLTLQVIVYSAETLQPVPPHEGYRLTIVQMNDPTP